MALVEMMVAFDGKSCGGGRLGRRSKLQISRRHVLPYCHFTQSELATLLQHCDTTQPIAADVQLTEYDKSCFPIILRGHPEKQCGPYWYCCSETRAVDDC